MNTAEQIKRFYTKNSVLNTGKMDDFFDEVNEKATSQEFNSDYSTTEYTFYDGSVLVHCHDNDEVRAYGCA